MEKWKPIPGYVGIYEASDLGRIRSVDGKATSNARYDKRVWRGRIMRQKITENKKGRKDARVSLWRDGIEKTHLVSRLVATAWVGTPMEGMTVNHINGNPLDNRPTNLEWVTLSENIRKGFETGLYDSTMKPVTLVSSTGEQTRFPSMAEATRWLGRSCGYVSNTILQGRRTVTATNGNRYMVF